MLLALKLSLTPVLVTLLTLAARRWGAAVAGVLAGLPLTSGPVSFFFALQYGVGFARAAAIGTMLALTGVTVSIFTYARLARHCRWQWCVAGAFAAYTVAIAVVSCLTLPVGYAAALSSTVLLTAIAVTPKLAYAPAARLAPWWDVPLRAIVATSLVLTVTAIANALGPTLAGAVSPFPVFVMVLTAFTHRHEGGAGAATMLRGVLLSLPAFVGFFLVVGYAVEQWSLTATYGLAALVGLGLGAVSVVPWRRLA